MKLRSNKGQSIVEFAYILPLMAVIVVGIIEFGVLFYNQAVVTNASREGARAGMAFEEDGGGNYWTQTQMETKVQQTVSDYLLGNLVIFGPLGTISTMATRNGLIYVHGINYYEYSSANIGRLNVQVTYQHTYLTIPDLFGWGNTINLAATTTMALE